mgnify:CR=1 FL=1
MKKIVFLLFFTILLTACKTDEKSRELQVINNSDSSELTFILELDTKENKRVDVEAFTQALSDFIVEREPSSVYGYYISEDGQKVTLIERYNNSEDAIQHGIDFINGPNFDQFFKIFESLPCEILACLTNRVTEAPSLSNVFSSATFSISLTIAICALYVPILIKYIT